jgi:hypothetical protein
MFILNYPLSYFPQGGKVMMLLPPWGKVGKGVRRRIEVVNFSLVR